MPQESLDKLLQECTLQIKVKQSSGTGFFIAPNGWILTCAHVVQQSDFASVLWSCAGTKHESIAQVKLRLPIPIDIAFLKIEEKMPAHKCVYLDPFLPQKGDKLSVFGYPQEYLISEHSNNGDSITLEYEGESFYNGFPLLKLKSGQVQEGFSGSPLLNERTKKVCGIISISRNTGFDLGGRATPSSALFQSECLTKSIRVQNNIEHILQANKRFHTKADRTWQKIILKSSWDRRISLFLAIICLVLSLVIYFKTPESRLILFFWRIFVACGFGYSFSLHVGSLNVNNFATRRVPVNALSGFFTAIIAVIFSFFLIPDRSTVLRNLTGINEYPVLGLVETSFPDYLKEAIDIEKEPIVETDNPVYKAIEVFKYESGNNERLEKYEEALSVSSAYNQGGVTLLKGISERGNTVGPERFRQGIEDFESQPKRFEGENNGFSYTSVLMPFQDSAENAQWTAFLQGNAEIESYKDLQAFSVIQYPALSDIGAFGSFEKSDFETTDNTWLQKVIKKNPKIRGFLGFLYKALGSIDADEESIITYLFPCGFSGILRQVPTPYARFLDVKNNSFSQIKISSLKLKEVDKEEYELTPVFSRDKIFQEITSRDKSLEISIPPGMHLIIPTEFGFDTRSGKLLDQNYQQIDFTTLDAGGNIFTSRIPARDQDGFIRIPSLEFDMNPLDYLDLSKLKNEFLFNLKGVTSLNEAIPNRFAVGSLRDVVSLRIDGDDVLADNPLNDPRFSMSAYFAYGSCPYLVLYDSEKGYWIEKGTVITGQQNKSTQGYEIHSLSDHISKIRIEERDQETTYLDSLSIIYTDIDTNESMEVFSQVSELSATDGKYFVLNQNESFELNLSALLPENAINVRLKIDGYYELLPGVEPLIFH